MKMCTGLYRSEPARSTRFNRPYRVFVTESNSLCTVQKSVMENLNAQIASPWTWVILWVTVPADRQVQNLKFQTWRDLVEDLFTNESTKGMLTLLSTMQVNTQCERLLSLFIFVAAIFLLAAPCIHIKATENENIIVSLSGNSIKALNNAIINFVFSRLEN